MIYVIRSNLQIILGIWPFDENSMKDKVVRKSNNPLITTSNFQQNGPINILATHSQASNSTSSSNLWISNSSSQEEATNLQASFISST